jgi:hypothetical protein
VADEIVNGTAQRAKCSEEEGRRTSRLKPTLNVLKLAVRLPFESATCFLAVSAPPQTHNVGLGYTYRESNINVSAERECRHVRSIAEYCITGGVESHGLTERCTLRGKVRSKSEKIFRFISVSLQSVIKDSIAVPVVLMVVTGGEVPTTSNFMPAFGNFEYLCVCAASVSMHAPTCKNELSGGGARTGWARRTASKSCSTEQGSWAGWRTGPRLGTACLRREEKNHVNSKILRVNTCCYLNQQRPGKRTSGEVGTTERGDEALVSQELQIPIA